MSALFLFCSFQSLHHFSSSNSLLNHYHDFTSLLSRYYSVLPIHPCHISTFVCFQCPPLFPPLSLQQQASINFPSHFYFRVIVLPWLDPTAPASLHHFLPLLLPYLYTYSNHHALSSSSSSSTSSSLPLFFLSLYLSSPFSFLVFLPATWRSSDYSLVFLSHFFL